MKSDPTQVACELNILLVEDDPLIGLLLSEMLAVLGHKVCPVAESETEAVVAAGIHRPDLMIVDARLHDGSGVAAMTMILQTGFIPHIFMSGNSASVRKERPDAIFLQKPFDEGALVRAIKCALAAPPTPHPA